MALQILKTYTKCQNIFHLKMQSWDSLGLAWNLVHRQMLNVISGLVTIK